MGGWPNDTDAKKAIRALVKTYGWIYDTDVGKSAHHTGSLLCGDGCRTPVFSTGRNTGRALWTFALRCTHGHRPSTRSP